MWYNFQLLLKKRWYIMENNTVAIVSLGLSIIQTVIMIVTVIVTWKIYKRKQIDTQRDIARKILVEYNKSIELIKNAREIISEDMQRYDVKKLLSISQIDFSFWDNNGYILSRNLNESEYKNIEVYFEKMEILFELLQTIKDVTKEQYINFYQKYNEKLLEVYWDEQKEDDKNDIRNRPRPQISVTQPIEYTSSVVEKYKEIELLLKVFPKEKLESLAK